MNVTIEVTQDDIDHGEINHCTECPIARAANRAGLYLPIITDNCISIYIKTDNTRKCIDLPLEAKVFVLKFDHYTKVEPFKFEISM